jgi:Kae1-associated kinase Bud32
MKPEKRKDILLDIGRSIGILHSNNLVHGDLTTSNILFRDDNLYYIDFSLGDSAEDIESKGVDLHLLMEAYESTHPELLSEFKFVLEGYAMEYEAHAQVIAKIDEIIKRGRYT